jgi:hypothetical protein
MNTKLSIVLLLAFGSLIAGTVMVSSSSIATSTPGATLSVRS